MEIEEQPIIQKDMDYIASCLNFNLKLFENSNILITGGAGFIGYYLVNFFFYLDSKKILKKNCRIFIWDSFIRGRPKWLKEISEKSTKFHASRRVKIYPSLALCCKHHPPIAFCMTPMHHA